MHTLLCWRTSRYLPNYICNLCEDVRSFVKLLLSSKLLTMVRYFSRPKLFLHILYMFSLLSDNWLICFFHFVIKNDLNKMLTLFLNFPSGFFRRRLISVFVVLRMFTMILIDSYHVGILERYNSLVSLYASFNSGNSFPRFSKRY